MVLLKDITSYGDSVRNLNEILPYNSDRSIKQYKSIRMYPMCWLGLEFTKLGLSDVPFVLECEDEKIKAITEKMLKKIWRRLIRESMEKLEFGFKAMEIRYKAGTLKYKDENDKDQKFTGTLLKEPKGLDGDTIEIMIETKDGSFKGFRQNYETEVLASDRKALVFTNHLESGNYYGISSLESIYPFWYDANINRQFHMRWLERKGTGLFKGRYPIGTSEYDGVDMDNQDVILDILDNLLEGTTVCLPAGTDEKGNHFWDIEIIDSEDKTDPFINRANYLDEMILKGQIIPEKALTQGEIGARASVEAFQNLFIMRKQDVLDDTVDTVNRYLLPNFIELNFGNDIEVTVTAGQLSDNSKEVAGKIVEKLLDKDKIGVDQQWLIDKTGIPLEEKEPEPEPEPEKPFLDEETGGEEEPDEIPGTKPEKDEKIQGKSPEKKGTEKKKDTKLSERWREFSSLERKFKLSDYDNRLDELRDGFIFDISAELEKQKERVINYLDKNYTTEKANKVVDGIEIKVAPIKSILRKFLNDVYATGFNSFKSGVEGVTKLAGESKGEYIGFRVNITGNKMASEIEDGLKYSISNQMIHQTSKPEILATVEEVVKKYENLHLTNIGDTESGFVFSKSGDDYLKENKKKIKAGLLPISQEIIRFQYSAILDDVVCKLCEDLDGLVVPSESPIKEKYSTPIHHHCRCLWIPLTKADVGDERIENTDLTLNKSGRNITLDQVTSNLGSLINRKTLSEKRDDSIHYHIYNTEKKKEEPMVMPIELNVNMSDDGKSKTIKKTVSFVRDKEGNLSGAEIKES